MTIVDLDFEEELKETNFPDLLEGAEAAPNVPKKKKKKKKKLGRKEKEATKQPDLHVPEGRPQQEPSNFKIVDIVASANATKVMADPLPKRDGSPVRRSPLANQGHFPASALIDDVKLKRVEAAIHQSTKETIPSLPTALKSGASRRMRSPVRRNSKDNSPTSSPGAVLSKENASPLAKSDRVLERRAMVDPPASIGGSSTEDGVQNDSLRDNNGGNESVKTVQRQALAVPDEELFDSGSLPDENPRDSFFEEDYEISRIEQQRSVNSHSSYGAPNNPSRKAAKRDFILEPGLYGDVADEPQDTTVVSADDEVFEGNERNIKTEFSNLEMVEKAPHDDTSTTANSDFSPNNKHAIIEISDSQMVGSGVCRDDDSSVSCTKHVAYSNDPEEDLNNSRCNDTYTDDDTCNSDKDEKISVVTSEENDDENSEDAAALLERAHDRIARQNLQDEVQELKAVIERKNAELENLAGQLRRAVETKCDLVVAHTELEKSHERAIQKKNENLMRMKEANKCLLEGHAATEKKMLNELMNLEDQMAGLEKKHQQELDDWERMHRNEMLEKDFIIAKLSEELRGYKLPCSSGNGRPQLPIL